MISTGIAGLDEVLEGLRPGDNVVWLVDEVEDYLPVLPPLRQAAAATGKNLVYFRFARHRPLLDSGPSTTVHELDPSESFQRFVSDILAAIEQSGPGSRLVFDCLSDLAVDWYSDRMLGNFFMIVCPYLYERGSIAYFALLKRHHSAHATEPIERTAQVIIEMFRDRDSRFIQPLRVLGRASRTMYMLHRWEGVRLLPVTGSGSITEILEDASRPWLEFTVHRPGVWRRTFQQAQEMLVAQRAGTAVDEDAAAALFQRLVRMMLTRDPRFEALVARYLDLAGLVRILERMIGTGMIGGKALGMLLARAIIARADGPVAGMLEKHDSFYVGADVFYTFLVQNGCWWPDRGSDDLDAHLRRATEAQERVALGRFPPYIEDQFREMLDHFGQSPLIVRSSSLLEDSYSNTFSGKYESVFCPNQGSPQERLAAFLAAVRTVYASSFSETSLVYRHQRRLLQRDEQMALLVQRVSGDLHGDLFFPHAAGVAFSFNPFTWSPDIEPGAGVLRLVAGLGTRAVERNDDDYTRLVALNAPLEQPPAAAAELGRFTQRRVDVLDLASNRLVTRDLDAVLSTLSPEMRSRFLGRERLPEGAGGEGYEPRYRDVLTFAGLLGTSGFPEAMREALDLLEEAYAYPVDVEFTVNLGPEGDFRMDLVQCRPFPVRIEGDAARLARPADVAPDRVLLHSRGPIVGHSLAGVIDRLVYVVPSAYSALSTADRYAVAQLVGRLAHDDGFEERRRKLMLVGPGRWGSTMPSLGLPVSFLQIRPAAVVCELVLMHEGLVPDVSLGTHFFNDMVEMDMLYLAVAPGREGHAVNEALILARPNELPRLAPDAARWTEVVRVLEPGLWAEPGEVLLHVDAVRQDALCYWKAGDR